MADEYVTVRRQCYKCKGAGRVGLRTGHGGLVFVEPADAPGVEQIEQCDICNGTGTTQRAVTLSELRNELLRGLSLSELRDLLLREGGKS